MGSFTGAPISFVFPALIHYKAFGKELRPMQKLFDIAMITIGIAAMIFGTWIGIEEWNE